MNELIVNFFSKMNIKESNNNSQFSFTGQQENVEKTIVKR